MKTVFAILFVASVPFANAQSYVDSGIRHYIAHEYEEALTDFEEALKLKSLFTAFSVSKLHYYKGMSLYNIHGQDLSDEMVHEIYNDLKIAIDIDSSWMLSTQPVFDDLYAISLGRGEEVLKRAGKESDRESRVELTSSYITLLNTCFMIKEDPKIELLKAQAYHEIGDLYFEDTNNVVSLQKAAGYFERAIEFYEIARYNDPFSREIIRALLQLSQRMDDPQRVKEYTDLLELAGG